MRIPFTKRRLEIRQASSSSSYTDLLRALQYSEATTTTAKITAVTALEIAAGEIGRALASARVEGDSMVRGAITPSLLMLSGRELIRCGEIVLVIDVADGGVRLLPVQQFQMYGGYAPESQTYDVTLSGPNGQVTRNVHSSGIVHLKYSINPAKPFRGIGPLQAAYEGGRLSSELTRMLADIIGGPRGSFLAVPAVGEEEDDDSEDTPLADLRESISKAAGGIVITEAGDWDVEQGGRNTANYSPKTFSGQPDQSTVMLMKQCTAEILSACGVPPAIHDASAASASREGYAQMLAGTLVPIGRIIGETLADAFETEVSFAWDALATSSTQGRARATKALVDAGFSRSMPQESTASLCLRRVNLLRRLLIHRASVSRNVVTGYDIYGSPITTLTTIASAVPCHWRAGNTVDKTDDNRVVNVFDARVWLGRSADVEDGDLLVITDRRGNAVTRNARWVVKKVVVRADPGGNAHLEAGVEAYA